MIKKRVWERNDQKAPSKKLKSQDKNWSWKLIAQKKKYDRKSCGDRRKVWLIKEKCHSVSKIWEIEIFEKCIKTKKVTLTIKSVVDKKWYLDLIKMHLAKKNLKVVGESKNVITKSASTIFKNTTDILKSSPWS